jgi:hypothetical protein
MDVLHTNAVTCATGDMTVQIGTIEKAFQQLDRMARPDQPRPNRRMRRALRAQARKFTYDPAKLPRT